jgi:hypothetical protein
MSEKAIIKTSHQELVPDEQGFVKAPIQVLDEMRQSIDVLSTRLEKFERVGDNLEKLVELLAKEREAKKEPTKFEKFQASCRKVLWEVNTVEDVEPELLRRLIEKDFIFQSVITEAVGYMKDRYEVEIITDKTRIYTLVHGQVQDDLGNTLTEKETYWKGLPEIMDCQVAHRVHRLIVGEVEVADWNRSSYIKDDTSYGSPYEGARTAVRLALQGFGIEDKPYPVVSREDK